MTKQKTDTGSGGETSLSGSAGSPPATALTSTTPPGDKTNTAHGELQRLPGESLAAWQALVAYAGMVTSGHPRPYPDLAQQFGVHTKTVYRWSSQHHWRDRLATAAGAFFTSSLQAAAATGIASAGDWVGRREQLRETEWRIHLNLIAAAQEALDQWCASDQLLRPADIARLLELASRLGRLAVGLPLQTAELTGHDGAPIQIDVEAALQKVYGQPLPGEVVDVESSPVPEAADGGQKELGVDG